jgi:DNA-binding NarL/FixJ family response regulator
MASKRIFTVEIELTSSQFRLLRSMAAKRSTEEKPLHVHDLVEQLVDRALLPMSARQYDAAHRDLSIAELHKAGLNDPEIARRLRCHPATVFRARQRLGLKSNDPRGGYHPKEHDVPRR